MQQNADVRHGTQTKLMAFALLFCGYGFFVRAAYAAPVKLDVGREILGGIVIEELHLRPQISYAEPQEYKFDLVNPVISFKWDRGEDMTAHMSLGSSTLRNRPARYNPITEDAITLVEAYGQWKNPYGRVMFGLIPIGYGVEGALSEAQLYFNRSLIFKRGVFAVRDLGVNFDIRYGGFYTGFTVHNGEGVDDLDGRVWLTSRWGYTNRRNLDIGLAGQTGNTLIQATFDSDDDLADVDPTLDAKWRSGVFYLNWEPGDFEFLLEAHYGSRSQNERFDNEPDGQFRGGHFDVIWDFHPRFRAMARADYFEPDLDADHRSVSEVTLGLGLVGEYETSVLYLLASRTWDQAEDNDITSVALQWKLSPSYFTGAR